MISSRHKITGVVLIAVGLILAALYFTVDFRFEVPVFAVFSSYAETRFFSLFKTNFADELILITIFSGLLLLVFSKEREEIPGLDILRYKAIVYSVIINSILIVFALLFVYGGGFMGILIGNIFSPFVLYILIFKILKRRNIHREHRGNKE